MQTIPAWVNGRLTPVYEPEVSTRGLRHVAAWFLVRHGDDRTLVQRRAITTFQTPGLWANACGRG